MNAYSTLPVTYGTVNGSAITGQVNAATLDATKVHVTLSQNYVRNPPAGYPDANPGVAPGTSLTGWPQTVSSGSRILLFTDEAAALVAAGAAAYS
jgi:hypothetical protein